MAKRWNRFWQGTKKAVSSTAFWVAPRAYSRRVNIRRRLEFQEQLMGLTLRRRDAANTDRMHGKNWLTSQLSPDSELDQDLTTYRERARDLYYNNPLAHGYVEGCVENVIGSGSTFQSRIREGEGMPAERADKLNDQIEVGMKWWGKACDRTGRKGFAEIERLVERLYARDGECLIVRSEKQDPRRSIPLCIEVIDAARLATPPGEEGNPRVRLGIEKDDDGVPVAYHIRTNPPADTTEMGEDYERVPAGRVLHIMEAEDPDQSRGVPSLHTATTLFKALDDYEEAVLVKQRVHACAALWITTMGNPDEIAAASSYDTNSNSDRLQEMNPGQVHYGASGEEANLLNPESGAGGNDHAAYLAIQHHKLAAATQYPYELLLKAYGGTNYASGRLSLLDGRMMFRARQSLRKRQFLIPIAEWVLEELVLAGEVNISAQEWVRDSERFLEPTWIMQGWPWVDPEKEVSADEKALDDKNKLDSRSNLIAARGLDDEHVQEQRLREAKRDADNEKALREYRKRIGLDEVAEEPAAPDESGGREPAEESEEEEETNAISSAA